MKVLSVDELRQTVPSIFTEVGRDGLTDRYHQIKTFDVVEALSDHGIFPVAAFQKRVYKKNEHKIPFVRHVIRFRNTNQPLNQEFNEVVLVNSHDGTTCYELYQGVFRVVCSNGLIAGDYSKQKFRHSEKNVDKIIEGVYKVVAEFDSVNEKIELMKQTKLDYVQQLSFAEAALSLKPFPIEAQELLQARRDADKSSDLWTTYNRVQENLLKGGLSGRNAMNRKVTSRPVTNIGRDIYLNRNLWNLAEERIAA